MEHSLFASLYVVDFLYLSWGEVFAELIVVSLADIDHLSCSSEVGLEVLFYLLIRALVAVLELLWRELEQSAQFPAIFHIYRFKGVELVLVEVELMGDDIEPILHNLLEVGSSLVEALGSD